VRPFEVTRAWGRAYFAAQAVAGAAWWLGVFAIPFVRDATLGSLPPVLIAVVDIPLFVIASVLVAVGLPPAVWVVVPWTLLVTAGLTVYATITAEAGWGVLLMAAASVGGVGAGLLVLLGRIPIERVLVGPLGFRNARPGPRGKHVVTTAVQLLIFWGLFLVVFPVIIAALEGRWGLHVATPAFVSAVGIILLVPASALGLWSAFAMSTHGDGTPLPSAATTRLVTSGPYRLVRNPMAVAGIMQGAAVGLILQSWLVVAYAIAGSVVWNWFVRPVEEADLVAKFGDEYVLYQSRVRCWIPRLGRTLGA
jgi:protein-S-isoprenylcysteine O-methyltransferase Ste14